MSRNRKNETRRAERTNGRAAATPDRGAQRWEDGGAAAPPYRGAQRWEDGGAAAPPYRGAQRWGDGGAAAPPYRAAVVRDFRANRLKAGLQTSGERLLEITWQECMWYPLISNL